MILHSNRLLASDCFDFQNIDQDSFFKDQVINFVQNIICSSYQNIDFEQIVHICAYTLP